MCDVCDAALFNYHWACGKCGFVVCLECYKGRKGDLITRKIDEFEKDRDEFSWLLCTNKAAHELDGLILVQIIPGNVLEETARRLDEYAERCLTNGVKVEVKKEEEKEEEKNGDAKLKMSDVIDRTVESSMDGDDKVHRFKHFVRADNDKFDFDKYPSIKSFVTSETKILHPDVQHSWLNGGKVLRLEKGDEAVSLPLFRDVWRRRQPVVVANSLSRMDTDLWIPHALSKKDVTVTSLNVLTGRRLTGNTLVSFYDGYEDIGKRIPDATAESPAIDEDDFNNPDQPRTLRLLDWPQSGEEFGEAYPAQALDLMKNLPLEPYTTRNTLLNLTAVLPEVFVRPDLGPRMQVAYGIGVKDSAPDAGTISLTVERADSISMLVHVGDTLSSAKPAQVIKSLESMDCGVDDALRDRIVKRRETVACVWHVFHPSDADKIRDFLNGQSNEERRKKVDTRFDPVHCEGVYLNAKKRRALKEKYGVEPFTIHQFLGETVFIPAGAPRQVILSLPNILNQRVIFICFVLR